MTDEIYMCRNCETEYDSAEGALECCQCERCAELEAKLEQVDLARKCLIYDNEKLQAKLDAVRSEVDNFVVDAGVSHKGVDHPTFCGCGKCFNCLLECFIDQLQEALRCQDADVFDGCEDHPPTKYVRADLVESKLAACNDLLDRLLLMVPGDDLDLIAELQTALGRMPKGRAGVQ